MARLAEACERSAWRRTAALEALIANCHRDPKKTRALKPRDFDPFERPARPVPVAIDVLKDVFIDGSLESVVRRLES